MLDTSPGNTRRSSRDRALAPPAPPVERTPEIPENPQVPENYAELYAALERGILGQTRHLTRRDLVERTGVSLERMEALWRSLGFTIAKTDEVLFVDDDVEALLLLNALVDTGLIDPRTETSISRSMGRSFARLAEWEIAEIAGFVLADAGATEIDLALIEGLIAEAVPAVEQLQNYTWRRHLVNAAGRMLLRPTTGENGVPMAIGFADIVGFTRQSRSLSVDELADLVETFEATVSSVIADNGGRVIKTIGDEVLFAADDAATGARIALALSAGHDVDDDFPQVRVGAAYGEVLSRMGDVFGEVVNIAARLTSLARPGRVLISREMADQLADLDEFRVSRARTTPVKGYTRLENWSLKRPKPPQDVIDAEKAAAKAAKAARREARESDVREGLEQLAEKMRLPDLLRRKPEDDQSDKGNH